jgi:hypothetical protein
VKVYATLLPLEVGRIDRGLQSAVIILTHAIDRVTAKYFSHRQILPVDGFRATGFDARSPVERSRHIRVGY